jgi:hypothetical protein
MARNCSSALDKTCTMQVGSAFEMKCSIQNYRSYCINLLVKVFIIKPETNISLTFASMTQTTRPLASGCSRLSL